MKEGQKRLLLLGGVGVGLLWLLNQKPGAGAMPGAVDAAGSPRSGSCPVYGQTWSPGMPIPQGCAVGHDTSGRAMFVDLQLFGGNVANPNIAGAGYNP